MSGCDGEIQELVYSADVLLLKALNPQVAAPN